MIIQKLAILRKPLLLVLISFCLVDLQAQETDNIQLGIEAGILPLPSESESLGLFLKAEPRLKVVEHVFLGLRLGITFNSHQFKNSDPFENLIDNMTNHAVISFVPTIDYYLNENYNRPYIGLGLGIHMQPYDIEAYGTGSTNRNGGLVLGNVRNRIGLLIRGGFKVGTLRLGLEYTFIPQGDIEIPNGLIIGSVKNSYLGLSIGKMITLRRKAK